MIAILAFSKVLSIVTFCCKCTRHVLLRISVIHIYMYILHVYMYMYIMYTHVHIHICTYMYMYVYICICHVCTYMYMYVYIWKMYVCKCIHMYTYRQGRRIRMRMLQWPGRWHCSRYIRRRWVFFLLCFFLRFYYASMTWKLALQPLHQEKVRI